MSARKRPGVVTDIPQFDGLAKAAYDAFVRGG